jgi:hypothetical protein
MWQNFDAMKVLEASKNVGNENVKANIKIQFFGIVNQRLGKSFVNVISVPDFFISRT